MNAGIDKNQLKFPSTAQKSIWHTSQFMSPFYEIDPPGVNDNLIGFIRKGEKEFYQFMKDLYLHMYHNTENYYIPTTDYDTYMKGRKRHELPHKNDSRECTLRNRFQHAIKFYQDFLYEIGRHGDIDRESSRLILSEDKFADIRQRLKTHKKSCEIYSYINALNSTGFGYKKQDDMICFFNKKYPGMFHGLSLLAKSRNKKYGYTCFLLSDYRGILNSFELGFNDTVFILNNNYKKTASELHGYMKQIGAKLKIKPMRHTLLTSFWKLQYTKNVKAVCSMHIDINKLNIFLNFNRTKNISNMGYLLKKSYSELYDWFYDHMKTMECSCKNNRNVDFGGKRKRICGLMNRIEIYNPGTEDLEKIKNVLTLYHSWK